MSQNTQYLYEYQNGKRVRNLGFMKIDRQMDKCVLQVYAKDMDEVKGMVFQTSDGRRYLGGWEPELYDLEERPRQMQEEKQAAKTEPEEAMQEATIPEEPMQKQQPIQEEQTTTAEEYIQPRNVTFEKIQRQDLSRLPRREWRLANNSFLLHGFYNYHHLLYIEDAGEVWIGVPGIFHEKEKMAANAFGFTHFRSLADVSVELDETEKNTYEDFGYWCRQIKNS